MPSALAACCSTSCRPHAERADACRVNWLWRGPSRPPSGHPPRTAPRRQLACRQAWASGSGSGDEPRGDPSYQPFAFSDSDYYRVGLQLVQTGTYGAPSGWLLLMRVNEDSVVEDRERGLLVAVGGDSLAGIAMAVQGEEGQRPLALDLLWRVLSRGREISRRSWTLVRVAIVGMRGSTYLGRLWFGGGPDQILWDCDARPSDSIWLAIKSKCPIFVHRDVWDNHSQLLEELQGGEGSAGGRSAEREAESDDPMAIRMSDPEVVKRMKGELRVAISEEDYVTAARLRDHPVMVAYMERSRALERGQRELVMDLDQQLQQAIRAFEAGDG